MATLILTDANSRVRYDLALLLGHHQLYGVIG